MTCFVRDSVDINAATFRGIRSMHVLIVEDERKMAGLLKKGLEEENHSANLAFDGHDGLEMALALEFDAIVLDLVLPIMDGVTVARHLRTSGNTTPILVLTARDTVPDVVQGLDIGADDYMTKPFSFEEFLARLRSVARRGSVLRPNLLRGGKLGLNPAAHQMTRDGEEIILSRTAYRLLEFLMRRAGRAISRNAIMNSIWEHSRKYPRCLYPYATNQSGSGSRGEIDSDC